ncbi:MAG TPA: tetratricopeptide repeat protein, partial [Cytophaga sp.]|nr:tetratricopeptide repeat protein [Cytophaga sp.]
MTKINRLALLIVIIFGHNCFAQEDSILYKQGIIYFDKKEYKPAVDFFTKAITLNKDFKKAYSARAISFINLNEYKNAELDFERILKIDSLDSKAYNGRGMLYFRQKRYSEAYLNFNKAIQ